MPLNNLLCGLLETGVNQLHQLDSSAVIKRKQLNGTIIGVSLKELNFPLYFVISSQQVDILNKFSGDPDCFIRVSVSALPKLQDNHQLTHLIKTGQLEVEGDIQLVQQFAQLLTDMEIDWEEHLSHKVGDVIAHKFCYHAKKIQQNVQQQLMNVEKQTALYITEEVKLAPSGLEVAYFCEQVKTLDKQAEKLLVKLNQYTNK
ncbi:SCP2 sterol-binding domain-containing protein [Psychromonas sp. SA13A]|uniref:ubiquinone biosynthesis accessory factor UbiJ n=1 Tax=Psychromonas sp. SA13A TaxID=2686346 RepID=UPI00140D36AA|nr:SCP2 sterol-binding domain-containing protein [Psychromonas sp. SA13A]